MQENGAAFAKQWCAAQRGKHDHLADLLHQFERATDGHLHLDANAFVGTVELTACAGSRFSCVLRSKERQLHMLMSVAVANDWPEVVAVLLKSKASASDRLFQENGATPIQLAAMHGSCAVMVPLVEAKAEPGRGRYYDFHPNGNDNVTNTPLMMAAACGQNTSFEKLLKLLRNDDCRSRESRELRQIGRFGKTMLHFASAGGSARIVRALICMYKQFGSAKVAGWNDFDGFLNDCNTWQRTPLTPLMVAAKKGHACVCALLIRAKAHDYHRYEKSASALDLAVRNGHTAVAAQLQRAHERRVRARARAADSESESNK